MHLSLSGRGRAQPDRLCYREAVGADVSQSRAPTSPVRSGCRLTAPPSRWQFHLSDSPKRPKTGALHLSPTIASHMPSTPCCPGRLPKHPCLATQQLPRFLRHGVNCTGLAIPRFEMVCPSRYGTAQHIGSADPNGLGSAQAVCL